MVKHICIKCKKEFNKKSNYLEHINRKFSCIQPQEILTDPQEKLIKTNNFNKNNEKFDENIEKFEENNINMCCKFCGAYYNRKDNLKRHMEKFCKVKKIQDEEKENIFKILLAKDEENKELKESNKELKEYIKRITDMNLDLNNKVNKLIEKISIGNINKGVINNNTNTNNINNINNNNIIITTDQLCNFGSEDIKLIDPNLFKNLNGKFGKEIFLECAKNIFNTLSKNKTLYFSDLSREKAMAWNNGKWNLIPMDKAINTINDQIRAYFKHNEGNYERLKIPEVKKHYDETIKKYYKMYYQEYDKTDRYEPAQSRLDEFNRVVLNGLKEFFYNIKEDVKNNYDQIQKKILDLNLLNKIEYKPEKKPRGRPKKVIEPTNQDTKPKKVEPKIKNEVDSDSDDDIIIINRPRKNKNYLL
jgi:hypothetical protein